MPFGNPVGIRSNLALVAAPAAPTRTTALSKLPRPLAGWNGSVARTAGLSVSLQEALLELEAEFKIPTGTGRPLRFRSIIHLGFY